MTVADTTTNCTPWMLRIGLFYTRFTFIWRIHPATVIVHCSQNAPRCSRIACRILDDDYVTGYTVDDDFYCVAFGMHAARVIPMLTS